MLDGHIVRPNQMMMIDLSLAFLALSLVSIGAMVNVRLGLSKRGAL